MAWEKYDDEQLASAVRNSSPELLGHHLRMADKALAEQAGRHAAEIAGLRERLTRAEIAGLRVIEADRKGRKTVRVADVLPPVPVND